MQKRKNHKGLIFGHQKKVNVDYDYWKFGIIKNNKKIIDNLLYYSSFFCNEFLKVFVRNRVERNFLFYCKTFIK